MIEYLSIDYIVLYLYLGLDCKIFKALMEHQVSTCLRLKNIIVYVIYKNYCMEEDVMCNNQRPFRL